MEEDELMTLCQNPLNYRCEFESRSLRGALDKTSYDKVCQLLTTGRWFSPVFTTNKADRHNIIEILLNVALNTKTT